MMASCREHSTAGYPALSMGNNVAFAIPDPREKTGRISRNTPGVGEAVPQSRHVDPNLALPLLSLAPPTRGPAAFVA